MTDNNPHTMFAKQAEVINVAMGHKPKYTLTSAKALVAELGFTLRHKDGEYVLRHKATGNTYHTASNRPEDLVDAVNTAENWRG